MLKQKEKIIEINKDLLNKYSSYKEILNLDNENIPIVLINKKYNLNSANIRKLKIEEIKNIAIKIFHDNHNTNSFKNNNYKIFVTNKGINESVQKMFGIDSQKKLIMENLIIFSKLGEIISNAKIVNQSYEIKGRNKYHHWNYFICNVVINCKIYMCEIEIASLSNQKNNYRIHRIILK